jgi:hypothetical protein
VVGIVSAALVRSAQGGALLVSLHPDGSVGSAANVAYGTSFQSSAGGVLPCDSDGRCLVIGQDANGHAIGSAWALATSGAWTDVSIPGGFPSATAAAQVVDLNGEPGIAVQDVAAGTTVWTVYGWTGAEYEVVGCSAAGPSPDTAALDPGTCLS